VKASEVMKHGFKSGTSKEYVKEKIGYDEIEFNEGERTERALVQNVGEDQETTKAPTKRKRNKRPKIVACARMHMIALERKFDAKSVAELMIYLQCSIVECNENLKTCSSAVKQSNNGFRLKTDEMIETSLGMDWVLKVSCYMMVKRAKELVQLEEFYDTLGCLNVRCPTIAFKRPERFESFIVRIPSTNLGLFFLRCLLRTRKSSHRLPSYRMSLGRYVSCCTPNHWRRMTPFR
jgi:hypothetical protein